VSERETLLEVKDVHVRYGAVRALQGVTICVPCQTCVAIVGVNGAGKSTLAKAIAGLIHPVGGEIWYRGIELAGTPAHRRVRMGISLSPERRRLFTEFTVDQNLVVGTPRGKTGQRELVYALFPVLAERSRQQAGTLSGGEQQMLAIGRALMSEPELFILDEPSLGLSPIMRRAVFSALGAIKAPGCTVVIMEQNTTDTLRIADYAYVMRAGRIAWEGKPSGTLGAGDRAEHDLRSALSADGSIDRKVDE
jgi:branched-chain amino acid transport system ATP-binding protein